MPKANALVSLSVVSILCIIPTSVVCYKVIAMVETKKKPTFVNSKLILLPIIDWLGQPF